MVHANATAPVARLTVFGLSNDVPVVAGAAWTTFATDRHAGTTTVGAAACHDAQQGGDGWTP